MVYVPSSVIECLLHFVVVVGEERDCVANNSRDHLRFSVCLRTILLTATCSMFTQTVNSNLKHITLGLGLYLETTMFFEF